jgi:hypothetical protein
MRIYDTILQGYEATEKNALDWALCYDFSQDESQEFKFNWQHHNFIDTVYGINVYYNATADYYFFTAN